MDFDGYDLFDECSDETAEKLLLLFVQYEHLFYHDVLKNLSYLLKKRGYLVSDVIEPIIRTTNWNSYAAPHFYLSYIANMPDFKELLDSLLSIVEEDCRDGLFIACMDCDDPEVLDIILKHFAKWIEYDDWTGGGTGERYWLHDFLAKAVHYFPAEKLHSLMVAYFERVLGGRV